MYARYQIYFPPIWDQYISQLSNEQWKAQLAKHMYDAHRVNVKILEESIRKAIRNARDHGPANVTLTKMIKGVSTPLIDHTSLYEAVGSQVVSWKRAYVGISTLGADPDVEKYANWVHWGTTIKITERMRRMFLMLHRVANGRMAPHQLRGRARQLWSRFSLRGKNAQWPRLTKSVIVIPPRPFLKWALLWYPKAFHKMAFNYSKAVVNSFAPQGKIRFKYNK